MPAIKLKKVTAEYVAERDRQKEETVDNQDGSGEDDDEAVKPYSCFDVEVLYGKRERTLPVAEQKLIDWLDSNLEKKEGVYLPPVQLYEFYSESCQLQATAVADVPLFNRYLREKFGRSLGWQDASPYKALLKEKKIKEKKAQGETLNIKMRDIIEEIITAAGNPRKGLRFNSLKVGIMGKYPAVRVDLHPNKLKAALERGVMYGKIERVKGMGMCGLYRLPGESTLDEEPKKKKKAVAESEKAEGESGKEEAANGTEDGDTGDEGGAPRTGTKRKATDDEEAGEEPAKKKPKKKKPKHKKKVVREYRTQAEKHCHPQRVEEAFAMAITFQSDPKITSVTRIKTYVARNYHTEVNNERLKKTLDAGVERGLWEKVSGSSYRLLIDTFHPGHSDTISERVCQAIVACHEPKTASAGLMKKYIVDYHPDLKVEARPHLFKAALERACTKGTLMRLTGIGAAGSFKLVDQFFPSPAILAGDSEDEAVTESEDEDEEQEERYVPRATKHRKSPAKPDRLKIDRSKPQPKKAKPQKPQKAVSREQRKSVDYAEDSDDEEVYYPTPTKKRGGGTPQAKSTSSKKAAPKAKAGTKRAAKTATPEPSAKRSTGSKNRREPATPSRKAEGGGRSREPVKYADASDESSDEETDYLPTPSRSRGGTTKPTKPPPPTPKTPKGKANVSSAKKSSKKGGVRKSRRR